MKLIELINKLHRELTTIKGIKFDGGEQYRNTLNSKIKPILENTELGKLLKYEVDTINLVTKEEINYIGGGEKLLSISVNCKKDKRIKYGIKGEFISVEINIHRNANNELLNFELKDLQPYYDKINTISNIKWYEEEIEKTKNKLLELEKGKQSEVNKLNDIIKSES